MNADEQRNWKNRCILAERDADALAEALQMHRADMHIEGDRPCRTCRTSEVALKRHYLEISRRCT